MKEEFERVTLSKPKITPEKDESSEDGVSMVGTFSFEVQDVDPEVVKLLGRYAAYKQPIKITVESPQGDLFERQVRTAVDAAMGGKK